MNLYFPRICCLLLIFSALGLYAGPRPEQNEHSAGREYLEGLMDLGVQTEPGDPAPAEPDRAETILRAIAAAYPDRIRGVEFYNGDWTIIVYRERFFWAEGRLLPASLRERAREFSPLPFYNYPRDLPPWREATPEESAMMREQMALRQDPNRPMAMRSPHFFDALWRTRNQDDAWENVKQIRFLGSPVMVHYSILSQLSLVEQQILRRARSNADIRRWIDSLQTTEGWVWRDIAQTQNRSFHSYGAAIDLLPGNSNRLNTYWLWSSGHTQEWWNIPYTRRYHPPEEVIRIFESFGFVWGGKWRYFDTMHFEYRPEVIILSGIPLVNLLDLD